MIPVSGSLPSDISFPLRKIVCLLKPTKEIDHDPASGAMKIRTITTFRNFDMDFRIGEEFTEDLGPVDGRTCQVCVEEQSLNLEIKEISAFVSSVPPTAVTDVFLSVCDVIISSCLNSARIKSFADSRRETLNHNLKP